MNLLGLGYLTPRPIPLLVVPPPGESGRVDRSGLGRGDTLGRGRSGRRGHGRRGRGRDNWRSRRRGRGRETESRGSQSRRGTQQGERDVSFLALTTKSDEPIDYTEWPSAGGISNFLFQNYLLTILVCTLRCQDELKICHGILMIMATPAEFP